MPLLRVSEVPTASIFKVLKERAALHVTVFEEPADYIFMISKETATSVFGKSEDGGSESDRNIGIHLPEYTVSQPSNPLAAGYGLDDREFESW
jgi:hypothetical protein